MPSYLVEMRSYRIAGWVGALASVLGAIGAFISGQRGAALGLLLFTILGAYVIIAAGTFRLDEQHVTHQSVLGEWRIRWDEITQANVGVGGGTVVLLAGEKRFVLSPPVWWGGADRDVAIEFLIAQFERHKISLHPSRTADYKTMKNVRVARSV